MQAFAVSPGLPSATLEPMNLAIAQPQRHGTVQRLHQGAPDSPLVTAGGG